MRNRAKLTPADILNIRLRSEGGETDAEIAADYGVVASTINRARNGFTWGHVSRGDEEINHRRKIKPERSFQQVLADELAAIEAEAAGTTNSSMLPKISTDELESLLD